MASRLRPVEDPEAEAEAEAEASVACDTYASVACIMADDAKKAARHAPSFPRYPKSVDTPFRVCLLVQARPCSAHTDQGFFTLLKQDGTGGLQALDATTESWLDVRHNLNKTRRFSA